MITEDYVSFEVAKLLKEKGFDLHDTKELYVAYKDGYCVINNPRTKHYSTDEFPKATHQMALKWLREVHHIFINIDYVVFSKAFFEYSYEIHNMRKGHSVAISEFRDNYETYEQACESAIKYCLENLI